MSFGAFFVFAGIVLEDFVLDFLVGSGGGLHADGFDLGFEGVAVAEGAIFYFGAVVIDGVDGVVEEVGDAAAVLDAEADEGKDAYVGVEGARVG